MSTTQYAIQVERERNRRRRNRIGPLRRLTASLRMTPRYIIAGAQKGGTTALHAYLEEHPGVAPALTKEIHYFDNNYDRGIGWYRAHFPLRAAARGRITGESSPSYLVHPLAPERIRSALPDARIIVLLRNPADRAYSHFQHNRRKGREEMEFGAAIDEELRRLAGADPASLLESVEYFEEHAQFSYLLRGIYAPQLRRWQRSFPPERILVLESEALLHEPAPAFRRTLEFLGLPRWEPEFRVHHHYGYDEVDPEIRARLAEFFGPFNEELGDVLGSVPRWE